MDQNTLQWLLWSLCYYKSTNFIIITDLKTFCVPANQIIKSYFSLFNFLKACQSVLIRNRGFSTFIFLNTTLHYTMIKKRYQHNASSSTYLSADHWVRQFRVIFTYAILANLGLSQENSSLKWFQVIFMFPVPQKTGVNKWKPIHDKQKIWLDIPWNSHHWLLWSRLHQTPKTFWAISLR